MPWTSPRDITPVTSHFMPCFIKKLIKILHNSRKNIKFGTEKKKILG